MQLQWDIKKFADLSPGELYSILRLRSEVFVVEQHCIYLDMDNRDPGAWHLTGRLAGELLAYARILPPGLSFPEPSVGRVLVSPRHRRTGLGKELMQQSLDHTSRLFGGLPVRIGAQCYLRDFYQSLGFVPDSGIYMEDGIEHVEMIRH